MKRFFYFLCAMCMMVLFASCTNTPTSAVESYLDHYKNGEYKAMVDEMYFKKNMTDKDKAELVQLLEDKADETIEKKGKISHYQINSEVYSADSLTATVKYTLVYGNGDTEDEKAKVVKVNDKWMVDSNK